MINLGKINSVLVRYRSVGHVNLRMAIHVNVDVDFRHLEFRKNVNNSGLDKDICTKFYVKMHHGHTEVTT